MSDVTELALAERGRRLRVYRVRRRTDNTGGSFMLSGVLANLSKDNEAHGIRGNAETDISI
jgi:hypothetical protein